MEGSRGMSGSGGHFAKRSFSWFVFQKPAPRGSLARHDPDHGGPAQCSRTTRSQRCSLYIIFYKHAQESNNKYLAPRSHRDGGPSQQTWRPCAVSPSVRRSERAHAVLRAPRGPHRPPRAVFVLSWLVFHLPGGAVHLANAARRDLSIGALK